MKTPKKATSHARRYDPEMIRDFLNQLHAELRVEQLEYSNPDSSSEELGRQLDASVKKYGTRLLYSVTFRDVTDELQSEIHRTMARIRQKQIEALEFLQQTVFKEAITCASQKSKDGVEKHLTFSAEDWLKWTKEGSPSNGDDQKEPDTKEAPSPALGDDGKEPETKEALNPALEPVPAAVGSPAPESNGAARKAKKPANRSRAAGGRKRVSSR